VRYALRIKKLSIEGIMRTAEWDVREVQTEAEETVEHREHNT